MLISYKYINTYIYKFKGSQKSNSLTIKSNSLSNLNEHNNNKTIIINYKDWCNLSKMYLKNIKIYPKNTLKISLKSCNIAGIGGYDVKHHHHEEKMHICL